MRIGVSALVVLSVACHAPVTTTTATPTPVTSTSATPEAEPAMPRVGDVAPDFQLTTLEGTSVALKDAVAKGPVVLVFGSFT